MKKENTMATLIHTSKPAAAKKSTTGVKALIMAASLAITVGGWGILATQQTQGTLAGTQPAQITSPSTSSTTQLDGNANANSSTVTTSRRSSSQFNAVARTRSSR